MKKLAITYMSLALLVSSITAFGQGAPKPIFGAKGGFNFANIVGDETDNKMKTAFHAGVYSEVFFDYFLMAQAEFLLSYQGHAPTGDAFSSSLNLWYINLPIMARYNLGYNFNVHAGIQLGFLLSAKSKYEDFDGTTQTFDQKEFLKSFDFGLPVGVGYEFWDRKLGATIRYIIPVGNISDDSAFTRRNSVFQVSIGIKIMTIDE